MHYIVASGVGNGRRAVCQGIGAAINEAQRRVNAGAVNVLCMDGEGFHVFALHASYPGPRNNLYARVDTWTWYNEWIGSPDPVGVCHWSHESREKALYAGA